jgi:hypothetical protein
VRIGAQLEHPKLTQAQLVNIAGNCMDPRHRLLPVCDDLLPRDVVVRPSRARVAVHAATVVLGIALAGGAAYGIAPGELGHHGATVIEQSPNGATAPATGTFGVGGASSEEAGPAHR